MQDSLEQEKRGRSTEAERIEGGLFDEILASIQDGDPEKRRIGLLFAESLVRPGCAEPERIALLVEAAREIAGDPDDINSGEAAAVLCLLVEGGEDLRATMLQILRGPDPKGRMAALSRFDLYGRADDLDTLAAFEHDNHLREARPGSRVMCYVLRDMALEAIERATGHSFPPQKKNQVMADGRIATWRDWEPYHVWRRSRLSPTEFLDRKNSHI